MLNDRVLYYSGAMRALACVGRRVLCGGACGPGGSGALGTPGGSGALGTSGGSGALGTPGGEARWARAALAGVAVAAKRGADRAVSERLTALPDAVKQVQAKSLHYTWTSPLLSGIHHGQN